MTRFLQMLPSLMTMWSGSGEHDADPRLADVLHYKFHFMLRLLVDVTFKLNNMNTFFQADNLEITDISRKVHSVTEWLEHTFLPDAVTSEAPNLVAFIEHYRLNDALAHDECMYHDPS